MKTSADTFPTPEQKAVIDNNSRITVVRACPGSGKTRVFGESLKIRLNLWTKKNAGIAAISFTNVAQEQIAKGIGRRMPYPHFIGTLDSFILRYVVRPFGHLVGLPKEGPRLIPSPLDEAIEYPEVEIDSNQKVSLFGIKFVDGPLCSPNMKAQTFRGQIDVKPNYILSILKKKKEEWRKRGRITHSDCQYI
jgi:DNA helicase-2/ATP-dependent DNA helicase PcrA